MTGQWPAKDIFLKNLITQLLKIYSTVHDSVVFQDGKLKFGAQTVMTHVTTALNFQIDLRSSSRSIDQSSEMTDFFGNFNVL